MSQPSRRSLSSLAGRALLLLAVACGGTAAWPATLMVQAVVLSKITMRILDVPGNLVIEQADVQRGYVDASAPVTLLVKSNSARGVMLEINTSNDHVQGATVTGLPQAVRVSQGGGAVLLPGPRIDESYLLRFRFHLARNTPPGVYPWPVQMAAGS